MMKNKKLKIIIIATLVLQLILPLCLLTYHYSAYDEAVSQTTEFRFPLEYIDIYNIYDTADSVQQIGFSIKDIYDYYNEDIEVTVGENGFAEMSEAKNKSLNKNWFTFKYYYSSNYYTSEEYEYVEGVNKTDIISRIDALRMEDIPNFEDFYLTAKVYKGLFIPTAIYYEGGKVIEFAVKK
jgi:hypothetical protein